MDKIYGSNDPFSNFPKTLYLTDEQGWNSQHQYLFDGVEQFNPRIIVEIGVWKGASSIFMADKLREKNMDSVVICVDTWLGSWDHWIHRNFQDELNFMNGYPTLFYKFMSNIIKNNLTDFIVPLPLDSVNAFHVLKHAEIQPDMVHIDGGHDYDTVHRDLHSWWSILRDGGLLVADDYFDDIWPGVKRACDEFALEIGQNLEHTGGKCRFRKPAKSTGPADGTMAGTLLDW